MYSNIRLHVGVLLSVLCAACGSSGHQKSTDTTGLADSVPNPEVVEPARLPNEPLASAGTVKHTIVVLDTLVSGEFTGLKDLYADAPGAFTFRKNGRRDASFGGRVKGSPDTIAIEWVFKTEEDTRQTSVGTWGGGTGWTGQPLYVEWPDSCMKRFQESKVMFAGASNKEIMVGSLASKVYFIDYVTGEPSRAPIYVSNPVKGTMSLDPTLNGNLYVGLGAPAERPFGSRVIDLYQGKITYIHPDDPKALRHWNAYDSSSIRVDRFLFWPGENGILYKFLISPGSLKLHSYLRYTVNGASPGMENSMAVYLNYGFVGDNHGNLICVDLETLTPIWHYSLGDDIDASCVVTEEEGKPYVYASCEVDRRGSGPARFVKLDALTGEPVWKSEIQAKQFSIVGKHFDGGYYASPLPGAGDCAHLIFSSCVLNDGPKQNGIFIAFNRATGQEAYRIPLSHYTWSSAVGFLNEKDEEFVVFGDGAGKIFLVKGITGEIITSLQVGYNFESSSVVKDNTMVIGSRGNSIFKLSIK